MARRSGPPPQPTALRILRGNPGKRRINRNEPQPSVSTGQAPEDLPADARRIWDEHAPELARIGVLTRADEHMLGLACRQLALGERLLAESEQAKRAKKNLTAALKLLRQGTTLMLEFGTTPAQRSRISLPTAPSSKSKWADLLDG